jgi:hypothetical protein
MDDDFSTVLGCDVDRDHQGWWVALVLAVGDDVVRHRIGPYHTERHAMVAAHHIRRAAGRAAPPPSGF